jgi:hypothetical protein
MPFFVGAALDFPLASDAPEGLPFKTLTEVGMRCASHEVHGCAADLTNEPIIRPEFLSSFYTHVRKPY